MRPFVPGERTVPSGVSTYVGQGAPTRGRAAEWRGCSGRGSEKKSASIWLIFSINISFAADKRNKISQFRSMRKELFSLTDGSRTGNE